jgi:cell division inhibitor SepF
MSFWTNLIGLEEEDEDEEELEEEVEEVKERKPLFGGNKEEAKAPSGFERKAAPVSAPVAEKKAATSTTAKRYTEQVKLVVIKPQSFEESPKLVDSLRAKKPVIINLEDLETDTARKIFDFLSGATYALNGNVQKVANNIFLFTPENVDVTYTNGVRREESAVKSPWN